MYVFYPRISNLSDKLLNFTNEFDLSQVKCGPQTATLRQFNFGFPGTYSIKSENFILLFYF